ncbi:MAG: adenine phosphoribosyltransferase [Akkermansiaceae bacterium]|nr:adenine phosphoribosyltransferase [Akkermansiaceae bacterium]
MLDADDLRAAIRDVSDFPQPGIVFKDITPILGNAELFQTAIRLLAETAHGKDISKVVGIDARGFIFAAAVADRLKCGFVPIRKKGKLPWTTKEEAYSLEYGEAVVEIHQDSVSPGENILLVDDLLATGGTAAAAVRLLDQLEANIVSVSFLIELSGLNGREKLNDHIITSILTY